MNTPHKTGRKIAVLIDQACKHRLGLYTKVLSPLASFLRARIWHTRKRSSGLAGCVNNLVVKFRCQVETQTPHQFGRRSPASRAALYGTPDRTKSSITSYATDSTTQAHQPWSKPPALIPFADLLCKSTCRPFKSEAHFAPAVISQCHKGPAIVPIPPSIY